VVRGWLLEHLDDHYSLYGEDTGVRSARKHLGWYAQSLPLSRGEVALFRARVNATTTVDAQRRAVAEAFDTWIDARTGTRTGCTPALQAIAA
jgi:tRNA-dihydrouridine synthase B